MKKLELSHVSGSIKKSLECIVPDVTMIEALDPSLNQVTFVASTYLVQRFKILAPPGNFTFQCVLDINIYHMLVLLDEYARGWRKCLSDFMLCAWTFHKEALDNPRRQFAFILKRKPFAKEGR
jgi:hypothetical protein